MTDVVLLDSALDRVPALVSHSGDLAVRPVWSFSPHTFVTPILAAPTPVPGRTSLIGAASMAYNYSDLQK
jgi:hypothetical protein